ncbi:MAG: glycosyltransferase 87 family protein [Actinomycetota bacterium]
MLTSLICCALTLLAGFLLKAQCLGGEFNANAYARLCYNDLQPLFGGRLFAEDGSRVFPYVHATLDGGFTNGAIEYPVLTGLFMYFSGLLVTDGDGWLRISALMLAPFALWTAYVLARMAGWRSLLWALAPALVLYAFHNWDLLVVAASVTGFWLWRRGSPIGAAVMFGIGAGLKMYPVMFLAPLFLEGVMMKDLRRAAGTALAGVGTLIAVNLPFALINWEGWSATYVFHKDRGPNFDSIWFFGFPGWAPDKVNQVTFLLTVAFGVGVLIWAFLRARGTRMYPVLETCGALLAVFLLWNKVHSPQYTLWLLPFFALLRVHVAWWVAYALADLAVYVGIFRWFHDMGIHGMEELTWAKKLLIGGVWARAALLLALVVVFLLARPVEASEPEMEREPEPEGAPA